ncbi:MAG: NFACT RNA binding domain-containing protein [Clostridiales bacterium]|nr:NFACT RNA binding domain-containing protein [Clostridiales bacterium]
MAFDGFVISNLVSELSDKLVGGRFTKISQPEKDELVLTIKNYDQFKLFISASAGLPLIYLTEASKSNPMTAPNFCMLLRKHLNSARILSITQPDFERIIQFKIEHLDDLGDVRQKYLIIEIMGKHSNIIFCNEDFTIIDSIKHISSFVSSVREVLPGRPYFIPKTMDKFDPTKLTYEEFCENVLTKPLPIGKAIYTTLTGISPLLAHEICFRATIDADRNANDISKDVGLHLYNNLRRVMEIVTTKEYIPNIIYKDKEPVDFSSLELTCYNNTENYSQTNFDSISTVLEDFYATKNTVTRIRQKSVDLRKIVNNAIERDSKKYDLQLKQLKDTEKREKYKIYGELLTTYGYSAAPGDKSITVLNYYTNEELTIPLDETMTALENAKAYFEKYSKLKRTYEHLSNLVVTTKEELDHLDSIRTSLDIAMNEADLVQLKDELIDYGYIKRHTLKTKGPNGKPMKKPKITSKPFHYVTSDGFHIYVGKNNYQNDELTFNFANGNDWWFHSKGIPGSHVIVRTNGVELPDHVFEQAGNLAAYYSKGREGEKVEIDYTEKKNVKKPNKGKPGFVVYYTNYSLMATPSLEGLTLIEE